MPNKIVFATMIEIPLKEIEPGDIILTGAERFVVKNTTNSGNYSLGILNLIMPEGTVESLEPTSWDEQFEVYRPV